MPYDIYGNWYPAPPFDTTWQMGPPAGVNPRFTEPGPFTHQYGWIAPHQVFGVNPRAIPFPGNDDDIRIVVEDTVAAHPAVSRKDFDNIEVEVENGQVTLSGEVEDRRAKYHAYDAAFWNPGVVNVQNNITVREPERLPRKRQNRGR